jgi:hypothetical protein
MGVPPSADTLHMGVVKAPVYNTFFLTAPFSHNTPRSNFIEERQAMRDISRLIRSCWHGGVEALGHLPRLGHYVDNNSAPTIASNLLEAHAVVPVQLVKTS